ncbi:AraC family transcriptional regulator [Runella sp. SP2]|uniref:helix-turn-helix domain-containing protein n=1 Tax=Runella sp. SP2 TaxID=2268026 RepID=UPI000F075BE2|nr:AraC family transcriptional regulator [Runella sp. SP2]AYQ33344.1 AraC family transcriptional regulator [Runella sp. SP2]
MNSNLISSPSDVSKKQTLTVRLQIEQKDTAMLLSFLLSEQISFEFAYQPHTSLIPVISIPKTPPASLTNTNEINPTPVFAKMSSLEKIKWAYEFYILQKHLGAIPSEIEISAKLKIAPSLFRILFKRNYGKGFYQLYLEKRMEYASELLRRGLKCNEVAKMVGYSNNSAIKFNKMFQKHFGMTPKTYQREHIN